MKWSKQNINSLLDIVYLYRQSSLSPNCNKKCLVLLTSLISLTNESAKNNCVEETPPLNPFIYVHEKIHWSGWKASKSPSLRFKI